MRARLAAIFFVVSSFCACGQGANTVPPGDGGTLDGNGSDGSSTFDGSGGGNDATSRGSRRGAT